MKNCARQARFDWLAQIFGRCALIGHGRIFGVLYSFPKLQDAFYHTHSSITASSTNVKLQDAFYHTRSSITISSTNVKLQDAFYHTRSSITTSSTNVKQRSTMADSKTRKCSQCEAKKPLSAFASAGAKTRYLKTCLECRTKVKISSPICSIY